MANFRFFVILLVFCFPYYFEVTLLDRRQSKGVASPWGTKPAIVVALPELPAVTPAQCLRGPIPIKCPRLFSPLVSVAAVAGVFQRSHPPAPFAGGPGPSSGVGGGADGPAPEPRGPSGASEAASRKPAHFCLVPLNLSCRAPRKPPRRVMCGQQEVPHE